MSQTQGLAPCCHCGVPLHQATQYVGIADIILGGLNLAALAVIAKRELGHQQDPPDLITPTSENLPASLFPKHQRRPNQAFGGIDKIPVWLFVTFLVCHVIQFFMGFILIAGAQSRKRSVLEFWLIITGFTALFTGLFIRIYEMIIVNEFARELLREENESESDRNNRRSGQRPNTNTRQTYPTPISTVSQNIIPDHNQLTVQMPPPPYEYHAPLDIPMALQPPPRYEDVVKENIYREQQSQGRGTVSKV